MRAGSNLGESGQRVALSALKNGFINLFGSGDDIRPDRVVCWNMAGAVSMGDYVWVSAIFKSATLNRGWDIDLYHDGKTGDGSLLFENENGLPIAEEFRPQKIWANADDPPIRKLPPVFNIDYAILVSEELRHLFEGFDLGEGDILPMEHGIFQSDQTTKYEPNYYSWVIGNKKSSVVLDQTEAKMKLNPLGQVWHLEFNSSMGDDVVAVDASALEGPDQWVDPLLQGSIFLSQKLGDRIVSEGYKEAFFLHRCRLLPG